MLVAVREHLLAVDGVNIPHGFTSIVTIDLAAGFVLPAFLAAYSFSLSSLTFLASSSSSSESEPKRSTSSSSSFSGALAGLVGSSLDSGP